VTGQPQLAIALPLVIVRFRNMLFILGLAWEHPLRTFIWSRHEVVIDRQSAEAA